MQTQTPPQVKFEAPGPGSWELETAHTQRPMTRFCSELFPSAMARGFAEGTARYGVLLDHLLLRPVHGFSYAQPVVVGAPPGATGTPPKLVFQLLTRLHPAIRRRLRAAKHAFETRLWREDLRRWDEQAKPAALRAHRAMQAVDPAALSGEELRKHLETCRDHLSEMIRVRHSFNMANAIPLGDFLAHAQEWTGKSAGELARLFKGSSPLSAQLGSDEPQRLVRALRESPEARALLASRAPAQQVLDGLLALPGTVGAEMRAHLDEVGLRSLGYDLADPCVQEVPEALVRGIRGAVEAEARPDVGADSQHEAQVRAAVPEAHRPLFDELLAEARLLYRLRDERATYTDGWALGLARRAVLAVGARLQQQGKLTEAELAIDASHDELAALLQGTGPAMEEELRRRAQWRKTKTHADAPAWLGAPPSKPPPSEWLPKVGRRANRAVAVFLSGIFEAPPPPSAVGEPIRGLPVSPGIYEGIARVVKEQGDLGRIEKGDVLVAQTTSPYFNVVLPLLGAIVTDRGGQLCHAAIITREFGIPGIVGTRQATKVVRDGARVRVNGTTGELQVLS